MPARLIITAAAVGLLVFAGAVAVDAGVHESGDRVELTEDFNVSQDAIAVLNQSDRDEVRYFRGGNVKITNESGTVMVEGKDHEWFQSNGTVLVLSQRLANDTATVDYGYVVAGDNLDNVSSAAGSGFRGGTLLIWVVTTGFIVAGARALGAV